MYFYIWQESKLKRFLWNNLDAISHNWISLDAGKAPICPSACYMKFPCERIQHLGLLEI